MTGKAEGEGHGRPFRPYSMHPICHKTAGAVYRAAQLASRCLPLDAYDEQKERATVIDGISPVAIT
jgi:hypothetical protein